MVVATRSSCDVPFDLGAPQRKIRCVRLGLLLSVMIDTPNTSFRFRGVSSADGMALVSRSTGCARTSSAAIGGLVVGCVGRGEVLGSPAYIPGKPCSLEFDQSGATLAKIWHISYQAADLTEFGHDVIGLQPIQVEFDRPMPCYDHMWVDAAGSISICGDRGHLGRRPDQLLGTITGQLGAFANRRPPCSYEI